MKTIAPLLVTRMLSMGCSGSDASATDPDPGAAARGDAGGGSGGWVLDGASTSGDDATSAGDCACGSNGGDDRVETPDRAAAERRPRDDGRSARGPPERTIRTCSRQPRVRSGRPRLRGWRVGRRGATRAGRTGAVEGCGRDGGPYFVGVGVQSESDEGDIHEKNGIFG
jgi:hypothetical protein